jgi:hypothetical protein
MEAAVAGEAAVRCQTVQMGVEEDRIAAIGCLGASAGQVPR